MAAVSNRRSVMTLFSAPDNADSHRVRIVLAEKDILADVINISFSTRTILTRWLSYGIWVLLFLGILFIFAYLLKKEYWKDVH